MMNDTGALMKWSSCCWPNNELIHVTFPLFGHELGDILLLLKMKWVAKTG